MRRSRRGKKRRDQTQRQQWEQAGGVGTALSASQQCNSPAPEGLA
jgi:hypothetical protein